MSDHPRQVLYIEDEELNALLVQAVIQTQPGWHLEVVRTAAQGLASLQTRVPDVLLLDLNLPDLSGLQIRERLRADPILKAIPCILLTADVGVDAQERAQQLGFFCVHHKPIQVSKLLTDLRRACESGTHT